MEDKNSHGSTNTKVFIERNAPNTFQNKSEWFIGAMSITKPKSEPGDSCFDPFVSAEDKNQNLSSVMLPLEEFYPSDWNVCAWKILFPNKPIADNSENL